MKTLIIYDDTGYIYMQMIGSYRIPQGGLNYIEIDEELYKYKKIKSVNIETKELILEDIKPSEIEILEQNLNETQSLLAEYVENKYNALLIV